MPKASDLKKGMVVEINGKPYITKQIEVRNPSSRGASTLYKVRFSQLQTQQKLEETLKGDDFLKELECIRMPVQYSYQDADGYVFMNLDDYTQYTLSAEELEGQVEYLTDGLTGLTAMIVDDLLTGIELPQSVNFEVIETAPAIKGASATSRTKPAKLSTGLEVQVPEYLETGEIIKVATATGKFMSRA